MPMHYTGVVCKIDEVNALATEVNIRVVEDARRHSDRHTRATIGTFGDLTCFSFDPSR